MPYSKPMNIFGAGSGISGIQGESLLASAQRNMNQAMQQGKEMARTNFASLMNEPMQARPATTFASKDGQAASSGAVAPNPAALSRVLEMSDNPLKTLNSLQSARLTGDESAILAMRTAAHRKNGADFMGPLQEGGHEAPSAISSAIDAAANFMGLKSLGSSAGAVNEIKGVLAEIFESGSKGIAAIGYDQNGGTSYGKFQIASRTGSMKSFIEFLDAEAPELAERLKSAGNANTGGRRGKMPEVWLGIAEEQPERFEALQDKFIRQSHFMPALQAVAKETGLAVEKMSDTFKEVLFSTAVQHGPNGAAKLFTRAVSKVGAENLSTDADPKTVQAAGEDFIKQVYSMRSGQFGSSTPEVQAAVKNRLRAEMRMALNMFKGVAMA